MSAETIDRALALLLIELAIALVEDPHEESVNTETRERVRPHAEMLAKAMANHGALPRSGEASEHLVEALSFARLERLQFSPEQQEHFAKLREQLAAAQGGRARRGTPG